MTTHDAPDFDGDLAALQQINRGRPGPECGVAAAVTRISESHPGRAAQVLDSIDNPAVPANAVAEFLTKHAGKPIKAAVIRYHRRRGSVSGCSCP